MEKHRDYYTLIDLDRIASKIIKVVSSKVLLFYGDMGVGKTTIIKALAKQLGVTDVVNSPSFSLVNTYLDAQQNIVYHFDFYRINEESEAYDIGFEDYLSQNTWVFIEWPQKIPNLLPSNSNGIYIDKVSSEKRLLTIKINI